MPGIRDNTKKSRKKETAPEKETSTKSNDENIKKMFEDSNGKRRNRSREEVKKEEVRPPLEEVQKKYPYYDPAPCAYICGPYVADYCEIHEGCPEYQVWRARYKEKTRIRHVKRENSFKIKAKEEN